ncbi:uncharacterized protein PRCAT00001303001 [Priceomyces carsonii]|uniref:uncharacterized protein n=1 Tax=Priceomyces carsonii TaxID=28549 RepID=UPI002EDB13FE|nr:unnamed protein product [Priceomyces carsonii]
MFIPKFLIRTRPLLRFPSQFVKIRHQRTLADISTVSSRHSFRKGRTYRLVIRPTLVVVGLGGVIYFTDEHAFSSLLTRSVRALYVMSWIAYEYSMNTTSYTDINDLHELAADRLFNLLMANKGLYIKLGQAIANQGSVFPLAFQRKLTLLYDDAPVDDWTMVDSVLRESLGENYESEIFESIEHVPIASASIAQVHKAYLKSNGDPVAVKVQHEYISKQVVIDLFMYRVISKLYEKVFDLPLSFFTQYISDQIAKETDFVHESQNAEHLRDLITHDSSLKGSNIYIPRNYRSISTERVLIMEWIDGVPLTDKERLIEDGYNLKTIMNQYLKVFGRQIFVYGFIHSDPHPGNVIARFNNGKQDLVILDHGLYVTLSDSFRTQYCKLWAYLSTFDREGIELIARAWGIQYTDMFASFIQLSPPENFQPKTMTVNDLMRGFLGDEKKFPLELLFLTRAMRIIQSLNQGLGSPANRINILTLELVNTLLSSSSGIFDYIQLFKIKLALFISNIVFYLFKLRQMLYGDKSSKGNGIEDYLDSYMRNTAKSMGIELM